MSLYSFLNIRPYFLKNLWRFLLEEFRYNNCGWDIGRGNWHEIGGRIVLVDGEDLFGSPSQDAARTKVQEGTVRALAIVWAPAGVSNDWLESVLKEVGESAAEFCDANVAESGILR